MRGIKGYFRNALFPSSMMQERKVEKFAKIIINRNFSMPALCRYGVDLIKNKIGNGEKENQIYK